MSKDVGQIKFVRDINMFEFQDHFLGSGVSTGTIGNLKWTETNSAAGTNTIQAGLVDHPGVFRTVTGAISGNNKRLHIGSTASEATFTPASFDRFRFVVRIPTITTLTVRLGLMQDISAASGGTAGAFFLFDPAVSANWVFETRQASTSTQANAVAVVANNWYQLEAIRHPSGNWEWFINGTSRGTANANLPTTNCAFGQLVQTGAAAARNTDLDYAYVRGGFGQLWT
jgi:hypothetical protein